MRKFGHLSCSALVLLIYVFAIERVTPMPVDNNDLYKPTDKIVLLNSTNIKGTVYNSPTGWFVEFYSSWCGHCQRFAPVWKQLAQDVLDWKDIVRIGAIDCANENNTPTCREFEVASYPTIKYIPIKARPDSLGIEIKRASSAEVLKKYLIIQMQKEQQESRGQTWPNIIPYKAPDSGNLWKSVSPSTTHIFLLFEEPDSILGTEVILDLHNYKDVHVRSVLSSNEPLCIASKVNSFPTLIMLNRDGSQRSVELKSSTKESVVETIKQVLGITDNDSESEKNEKTLEEPRGPLNFSSEAELQQPDLLYHTDVLKALQYSLLHEVPMSSIDGERLTALKNYLLLLQGFFPFEESGATLLKQLSEAVREKHSVSGRELSELVDKLVPMFPKDLSWRSCRGSSEKYRGYPCGLWSLFHVLSVNYAVAGSPREDPARVLRVMRDYVKHFFGCWDCAEHFVEMTKRRHMLEVQDRDQAVLWLWRAHNEVNERLAGDLTEDPLHRKTQYPTASQCPQCRYSANHTWNDAEVLVYLNNKYSYTGDNYKAQMNLSSRERQDGTLQYLISAFALFYMLLPR